MQQVGQV